MHLLDTEFRRTRDRANPRQMARACPDLGHPSINPRDALEAQSIHIFSEAFARLKKLALLQIAGQGFERHDPAFRDRSGEAEPQHASTAPHGHCHDNAGRVPAARDRLPSRGQVQNAQAAQRAARIISSPATGHCLRNPGLRKAFSGPTLWR
jgi:hypothetical protein